METADVVIIGAGVVGLATAAELSRRWPEAVIVLLEKNRRWGLETSSRNSEVIHAGLYYPASSLKTRFCLSGNPLLYEYCSRMRVEHRRTGKLVAALTAEEEGPLEGLYAHSRMVGAKVELLSGRQCRQLEPLVPARMGLYSHNTGIVDSEGLMRALYAQAVRQGVLILLSTPLLGAQAANDIYELQTPREVIRSRVVVNCAGLESDRVAHYLNYAGDKPPYRLYFCKGEYYCLRRRLPINHLVYPLPGEHSLGVHVTMDLAGNLRLGPNAYYVDRVGYDLDPSHAQEFYQQATVMLPGLTSADIIPGYAGIRPKLQGPGQAFHDFVVADEIGRGRPGWINLIGIESPGLTASLAIAEDIAHIVKNYR